MMGVSKFGCVIQDEIYLISLLEGDNYVSLLEGDNYNNYNNEDYCINSTDLVPTCNDSLLTYFFDHDDEEDNTSFSFLTVSNVILDCG